jgi:hypothetical protein
MFNVDNKLVQDYALLINNGLKTIEDVPDFSNLRDVVSDVLGN